MKLLNMALSELATVFCFESDPWRFLPKLLGARRRPRVKYTPTYAPMLLRYIFEAELFGKTKESSLIVRLPPKSCGRRRWEDDPGFGFRRVQIFWRPPSTDRVMKVIKKRGAKEKFIGEMFGPVRSI